MRRDKTVIAGEVRRGRRKHFRDRPAPGCDQVRFDPFCPKCNTRCLTNEDLSGCEVVEDVYVQWVDAKR